MTDRKLQKTVSVIVPVYNEAAILRASITSMLAGLERWFATYEIVLVESGSTDGTVEVVDQLAAEFDGVHSCHQAHREGMGSAIRCGIAQSRMEYLFWTDADHPVDISELYRVLQEEDEADLITGYRLERREGFKRYLYSKVFNLMVNLAYRLELRDINFAFKVYRRCLFEAIQIESQGSFFAAEICIKAKHQGFQIKEVGISYHPRDPHDSKLGNLATVWGVLQDWRRLRHVLSEKHPLGTEAKPVLRVMETPTR